jgi:indolepyruvate ferredoxin oxidoreductase alpha subunit
MERSFKKEVQSLRLGAGETFHGEGILAVTKASACNPGVSYVGGYQGAPVSHLLDVMVDAEDYLKELGVHVETCTNEASAAAMLGASINYPIRGAVTWKAIVGTNVASDALSNLASPGVMGGAMIIVGEDYGEGGAVIQERSHAYALKSSIWLLDPRPDLTEHRAHRGERLRTVGSDPRAGDARTCASAPAMSPARSWPRTISSLRCLGTSAAQRPRRTTSRGSRIRRSPSSHEKLKIEERMPAARDFIQREKLNELFPGDLKDIGIIVQGGLFNGTHARARAARPRRHCSANAACRCCASTSPTR